MLRSGGGCPKLRGAEEKLEEAASPIGQLAALLAAIGSLDTKSIADAITQRAWSTVDAALAQTSTAALGTLEAAFGARLDAIFDALEREVRA